MKRIDKVYDQLKKMCFQQYNECRQIMGIPAIEIADILELQRTNVSSDLNRLWRGKKINKIDGKPVLYKILDDKICIYDTSQKIDDVFDNIVGANQSLKNSIQQAKAAILYPPMGLHTLLLGETGTGKSMFAEVMYEYAKEAGRIKSDAPFETFNCADYANNPQLLMSQLFGVKKGAYTGADKDKPGIIEKADEGVLFLDEIHRLSPEGQEMLFYLIDKGFYRKLGETEVCHSADVLIICATTEDAESVLLKTFIRRIPMIIKLPALRDRTIEERYNLTRYFLMAEASSIKTNIMVTSNSLKALLLYDCQNNIGQLKSDIKLCCAKAFLGYMMKRDKTVCIHSQDLPDYIRRGFFKYKEYKDSIDKYIYGDYISFSGDNCRVKFRQDEDIYNFYKILEEKRDILKSNGLSEKDINLIMGLDIDTYIKKYMYNLNEDTLANLYKVVDKRIVTIVEEFIEYASNVLNKQFSSKILYGLSIHVSSSIERLLSHKKIENNQLSDIKKLHEKEYNTAKYLSNKLEMEFSISIPDDEVGFIAMFLYLDKKIDEKNERVGVVVAMHGESAATSIVKVVNSLLNQEHAIGYNMPLNQKPEIALDNLTEIIKKANHGKGVLLLVDMGSLALFGDMIYERVGIPIKTIDMVSTPIVLEAVNKALLNNELDDVYNSVINLSPYVGRIYKESFNFIGKVKDNVIITACITGRGTANKLKMILEQKIDLSNKNIDIIPIEICDKIEYQKKIDKIKMEKNILAIVSAINPEDDSILYISASDMFDKSKLSVLKQKVESIGKMQIINDMENVISENTNIDSRKYIKSFREFYLKLLANGVDFSNDLLIGLILHIACVVECVSNGKEVIHLRDSSKVMSDYLETFCIIKSAIKPIEYSFDISIPDDECVNIVKIINSL